MTAATFMNSDLVLTGVNLPDCGHADVGIIHERFADVRDLHRGAVEHIPLDGCLLLPGLVDAHLHLDKTTLGGPWRPHAAADTISGRIENERRLRSSLAPLVRERANLLIELAVSQGTVVLRTHVDVDVDEDIALTNLEAAWNGKVEIQVVAFPQGGILRRPKVLDLLDAALQAGADLVGGLDPQALFVFDLAAKHAKGVDIHLHEGGAQGAESLRHIARLTRQYGLAGQVAVSYVFCLGAIERDDARRLADDLALCITAAPGAAPMPPVDLLRQAGVRVAAGSDNVRDLWSPFGNASMLERCMLVAYRSGWRTDEALTRSLDLATTGRRPCLSSTITALGSGSRQPVSRSVGACSSGDRRTADAEARAVVRGRSSQHCRQAEQTDLILQ